MFKPRKKKKTGKRKEAKTTLRTSNSALRTNCRTKFVRTNVITY